MDLRHLRYFQAVAEELSFSRASRRLRIAQPALSRAIKEMEQEMQIELFERSRQYVRLTPAGATMLQEAGSIFERWDEALRRVKRTASGEEGELRLGYVGPPTAAFLSRLVFEYRRRFPLVSLHLEERTPERVWEMVATGKLSAALTRPVSTPSDLGLRTLLLREERLGAALRPDHPLADRKSIPWKLLAKEPLVILARREGASLHDTVLAGCRQAGFVPKLAHTPSLIGTVITYVAGGAGVGVVTDSIIEPDSELRFVPLIPAQTVPLVLVWHADYQTPPVERLREMILDWKATGRLWPKLGSADKGG